MLRIRTDSAFPDVRSGSRSETAVGMIDKANRAATYEPTVVLCCKRACVAGAKLTREARRRIAV